MLTLMLLLMAGLEVKHFVADYLLQAGWMIAGKGRLGAPGGYAHAGLHAVLSAVVLLLGRIPVEAMLGLVVAEFVIHYALDYSKAHYGHGVDPDQDAPRYWSLHGLDQLLHQLTYVVMIWLSLLAAGANF